MVLICDKTIKNIRKKYQDWTFINQHLKKQDTKTTRLLEQDIAQYFTKL